jgi:hypothetical protein
MRSKWIGISLIGGDSRCVFSFVFLMSHILPETRRNGCFHFMCSLGLPCDYSIVRCSFFKVTIDVSRKICANRMESHLPHTFLLAIVLALLSVFAPAYALGFPSFSSDTPSFITRLNWTRLFAELSWVNTCTILLFA